MTAQQTPPPPLALPEGLDPSMCYTLRTKITDYEYTGNLSYWQCHTT